MTSQEFILKVSKWENYFNNGFQKDLFLRGCMTLVGRIANRVRETGITGEGRQHQYSTKDILVGAKSFENKMGFNRAMQLAKGGSQGVGKGLGKLQTSGVQGTHWITYKGFHLIMLQGGYKMIRQLEGKPTFAKNYTRTTEMWNGFGIKAKENKKITIGGRTEASQNKINWNSSRDKDNIIAANQTELNELRDFLNAVIKQFLHDSFSN